MSDTQNILLSKNLRLGNVKAFEKLMDVHYQKLCGYAYSLTHNHEDTEDLVQNVFAKLWKNRKKIDPEFPIKNYLYKAVYNEFVDLYRRNKPVTRLELKYLETLDSYVESEPENLEMLLSKVYEVIDNLPPKCREIFLMNKKEGLTHVEISEYLKISLKTVEFHISIAFKKLRESLNSNTESLLFLLFGKNIPHNEGN